MELSLLDIEIEPWKPNLLAFRCTVILLTKHAWKLSVSIQSCWQCLNSQYPIKIGYIDDSKSIIKHERIDSNSFWDMPLEPKHMLST